MLYQKYRPKNFSEIIKPNLEIETIQKQIIQGKVFHAYIFSGSRGIGKTSTARILAKAVNCLNFKEDVCGECENCKSFQEGNFVDVVEIDGASNRGIDDARELRESLKFRPLKGLKKVYIIDEVHMLTPEAFNALLKAIEEPPEYVIFILCTTESHKIPETIKSRCQLFNLKKPTDAQIIQKLKLISEQEGISLEQSQLEDIATQAGGAFRDAETLLSQLQDNPEYIANLNTFSSKLEFFSNIFEKNSSYLISFVSDCENRGVNIVSWVQSYISFVRTLLHIKLGLKQNFNVSNPVYFENIKTILENLEVIQILDHLNSMIEIYSKIKYSQAPELMFEVLFLKTIYPEIPLKKFSLKNESVVISYPKNNEKKVEEKVLIEQPIELKSAIELSENLDKNIETTENIEQETQILEQDSDLSGVSQDINGANIDEIKEKWGEVVKQSGLENKTIETLLKVIRPISLNNDIIVLEVDFKFHAERLDNNKNKLIIEKILYSVFGKKLFYKTQIQNTRKSNGFNLEGGKGNLTDYNVATPKDLSGDDVLAIFDGGVGVK